MEDYYGSIYFLLVAYYRMLNGENAVWRVGLGT